MHLTVRGCGHTNMSDFHEMYESWQDLGYDPAYVGEEREDEDNRPVRPDDWARNNEDLEGGF